MRFRRLKQRVILWVSIIIVFLIMMFPIYTMFLISVIPRTDLYTKPFQWIPWHFTLNYFTDVLRPEHMVPVIRALINSSIVAVSTTFLCILLGSFAAYALSRLKFPHRERILTLLLAFYMLPAMLFLIPIFLMMKTFGLLDTYISLILCYTVFLLPFIILMLKTFFDSVPKEIEEAAQIDGCSKLGTMRYVIMPLAAPGLVAAAIYAFIASWNEFLTPLILTGKLTMITTALGLYRSTYEIAIGHLAAAGIYSLIPVILLTVIFQKYIVKGIVEGAIKG